MEKKLIGMFNKLYNGDFQRKSETHSIFPDAWLQIGGNHQTSWKFADIKKIPSLEIKNLTALRAGIIQTYEASLDVRKDEDWQIFMVLKSGMPDLKAYLRMYPISSNGDISKPWEFSFSLGMKQEQLKQVVSVGSEIQFLRLEMGVLGPGDLYIYKLIAYPLTPNRMKRRVTMAKKEIHHINTIGEIIKPIHLAAPIPLKLPVTVQANVNADIRNLTTTRDRVQICGSSQVPLATSSSGRAQVEIFGHGFHESLEDVTASQTMSETTTRDVSALPRFSFAVYNFGTDPAHVQAELSPDGVHWRSEGDRLEVGPGKLVIVSSKNFLRYTRLSYWADGLTTLRIWVQAQN
ncbi:MAG: hypothetical protein APF81_21665 [Desulfosporosinus sp. BRH_c37]|nr:MAG: hypothetical protein APF81_21665 [Desulfosporosinus sp. BRH_c37]